MSRRADCESGQETLFSAAMPRKVLLIVHQASSDTGRIGRQLGDAGYQLDICCPRRGDSLPKTMDEHAAAVVFGGPSSVHDAENDPGIRKELDWVPTALNSGKPLLGICLGAQILARAMGARVAFHPEGLSEIGYHLIKPTRAWQPQFERPMYFYEWHKEGFELPAGATLLAEGDMYPNQAFRYGKNVYAIQFHPEVTREILMRWTKTPSGGLLRPEAQPRDQQIETDRIHAPMVEEWTRQFLEDWLGSTDTSRAIAHERIAAAVPSPGD